MKLRFVVDNRYRAICSYWPMTASEDPNCVQKRNYFGSGEPRRQGQSGHSDGTFRGRHHGWIHFQMARLDRVTFSFTSAYIDTPLHSRFNRLSRAD